MSRIMNKAIIKGSNLAYVSTYSEDLADVSSSETLTNGALTSGTGWSVANDATLAGNKCSFAFSAGTASTLTQAQGGLATAAIGSKWYKLVYTISGKTGSPTATITTGFADEATDLPITTGINTVYFKSKATPVDFVISSTMIAGQAFDIDTLSLKSIADVLKPSLPIIGVMYAPASSAVTTVETENKNLTISDYWGNRSTVLLKAGIKQCLDINKVHVASGDLSTFVFFF